MKIFSSIVFLFLLIICIASCAKKTTPTATVIVAQPKASLVINIEEGQRIYQASCGRCHRLPSPAEFTQHQWTPIMDRMCRKARFTENQKANALAYVLENAKAS